MTAKSISSSAVKTVLWIPLACLAGFIAGTWGAHDELRAYRESVKEDKVRSSKNTGGFDTFAGMMKIPEMTRRPRKVKTPAKSSKPPQSRSVAASADSAENPAQPAAASIEREKTPPRRSMEDLGVRIEEAQELWRTRVEIARSQWKSKLKLSGESERAFDTALQEMNERLYDSIATVAEIIEGKETMSPELGLRLVGETTSIMAETYDKIGACVPQDMRSEVSAIQMVDFVDPGVAEPLVGVQGKIENFGMRPGRGR